MTKTKALIILSLTLFIFFLLFTIIYTIELYTIVLITQLLFNVQVTFYKIPVTSCILSLFFTGYVFLRNRKVFKEMFYKVDCNS